MKISLNWLKEYVDIPADLEISKLAYDLTMATVEVEGWTILKDSFNKIVVGVVREIEKHPNADKLTVCQVDIGGETKEIVCGGTNLRKSMKVAVSMPGAMVRWHGEGELVEIKKSKVRGVESFGMICASSEIGLFDLFPYTDDGTIADLSAFEAPAGTNVAVALGIDDVILEIDNKSLTNRPDLWGHYGIAREISAFYKLPMRAINTLSFAQQSLEAAAPLEITLKNPERSPRYIGVKIEGLSVKPSPFEIQTMLWRVGLRPINAIVDITNYVMLATGQPTHAFDAQQISGHITVRTARDGEKLLLLDDKELTLCAEDLVIADDEGAVGLAGVMGGKRDSVLATTSQIILEIANFEAMGIRRTASRYDTRTDAATRYEKAIDPQRAELALSVALEAFTSIYPDMKMTAYSDNYPLPLERKKVEVSLDWLTSRLGKRLENEYIKATLELLGFGVTINGDTLSVLAPSWRSTGDISIPDDIMEELARIHGYENFEIEPIITSFTGAITKPDMDRTIREYFAFRCGMREIFTYPWVRTELVNAILGGEAGLHKLSAPPSPDEKCLRSSLLPNICKAVASNVRHFDELSIFESAQVFLDGDFVSGYDTRESLPVQKRSVGGAFVGAGGDVTSLFRRAKGVLENLPRLVHAENFLFDKKEKPFWADEVCWLNLVMGERVIGHLGLLSKKAALACGIKNNAVMLFEFELDALTPLDSRTNKFVHLPDYPMTEYDLSLLFDLSVKWQDIHAVITSKNDELLRDVSYVGEYRGKQIPEGKRSITFRLLIGALDKTLNSNEIENYANAVVKRLAKQLGAEVRTS
ncbi:MAG: phenylalanine--tRNA ligase subunit beta [Defluviitaleaceae bacterium]|nr:phenylalanine--tRNA ligase subunit beta [Defluviitaleaceae bacterium]